MHLLLEHINQDIKGEKSEDKDSTVKRAENQSKKQQQIDSGRPDNSQSIKRYIFQLEPS